MTPGLFFAFPLLALSECATSTHMIYYSGFGNIACFTSAIRLGLWNLVSPYGVGFYLPIPMNSGQDYIKSKN